MKKSISPTSRSWARDETRRTYVVRLSPVLLSRALSVCESRGDTISALARAGLAMLSQGNVDIEFFASAAQLVDAAGALLNTAAHRMNSCARRFGDVPVRSAGDLETFERLVGGSAKASSLAASAIAPLCRAGTAIADAIVVMTDEASQNGRGRFTESVGVRLSASERGAMRTYPYGSAAALRLALSAAAGWEGEGLLVVADPSSIAVLNRSVLRWRVNKIQIHSAASSVADAQLTSRYLSSSEAVSCRRLISYATAQADSALSSLERAMAPIAAAVEPVGAERGITVLSPMKESR